MSREAYDQFFVNLPVAIATMAKGRQNLPGSHPTSQGFRIKP